MKKLIATLAVIFMITSAVIAQQLPADLTTTDTSITKYEFCQFVATGKLTSSKVKIQVEYGQVSKITDNYKASFIQDENGTPYVFNSIVHALNMMGENGWKLEQAYVISSYYYYLFSRKVKD